MSARLPIILAAAAFGALVIAGEDSKAAEEVSLLSGQIVSSDGTAVAGVTDKRS